MVCASQISFDSVAGTGTYNNSLNLLTDGYFPPESTQWQTKTVWWHETTPKFTFNLGELHTVEDIILSIDNNDSYKVDYSANSSDWSMLFTISSSYGEINWGMDTIGTVYGIDDYVWQIDFSAVEAKYLRIYAIGGDNSYSIGEFQAFGSPIPEPATMLLIGSGLIGFAGARRKFKK